MGAETKHEVADNQAWEASASAALAELSAALIAATDIGDISQLVLEHAKRLTLSPFGFVGYLDPSTGRFVASTMTHDVWDACAVRDKETAFNKFGGLWGWVLKERRPVLANTLVGDSRSGGTPPGHLAIRSFLGVPAVAGDELIGMVALANSERDYAERDLRIVERMAAIYGLVVQRHRADEVLRRERDFSSAVLDTVANLVVVLDRHGRIVRFNRACERTTGYSFDEVEGKEFWDYFLLPEEAAGVRAVFNRLVAGQTYLNYENHWITKDGRLRRIAWTNAVLPDERGEVGHVIATGLDITEQRQTEGSLRRHRLLATHARDVVFVLSLDGKILEANEAAIRTYGYTHEELLALSVRELRSPDTVRELAGQMAQAEKGGILFETYHRRKDGSAFAVEVSSQGADVDGQRVLISIVRDIGERKRAEAERAELLSALERHAAQLRATFASVADGLIVYDGEGKIVTINDAAASILGFTAEEVTLPLAERLALLRVETATGHPLPVEETPAARALRGETVRGMVVVARTTSRQVWISISAAPIRGDDGQLYGAVSTFSDITALHDLEEQREDYIRTISHDLRSPLTVVTGMTEWLYRRLSQQGMEREASVAEKTLRSATRMGTMVSDLLDSIRLEAGQTTLRPEATDLGRLAVDVVERFGSPEERARVRLVIPAWLPPAHADAARVERALVNLIGNALKYSPADQMVEVRLDADGERVIVAVQDRGQGIAEEEMPHLFERFYRAATGERVEGTGLGLYITRLIAEAHGGRVWAESEPGRGSTFYLSLPVAK